MKQIIKGFEPATLAAWKQLQLAAGIDPVWGDFRAPQKPDGRLHLLREQGSICCYCMGSISAAAMHIEHLNPRATYPLLELEWTNLLGCCAPKNKRGSKLETQSHCGEFRGIRDLPVTPLQINCEGRFGYNFDGHIKPLSIVDIEAIDTITNLNLNAESLRNNRKNMIERAYEDLEILAEQVWLRTYIEVDNSIFPEYSAMIKWFYETKWQKEMQAILELNV